MRTLVGIALGIVICCSGCGGDGKATLYPVKGKVTVGGKPLTDCMVNFTNDNPAKGAQAGYSGKLSSTGEYELVDGVDGKKGAAPGKYKVSFTVVVSQEAAKQAMMAGPSAGPPAPPVEPFPKEYGAAGTSPKQVEVKAESNTIDLPI